MNPGDCGVFVVGFVPVVVEPEGVDRAEEEEVSCAAGDVAFGAEVVDILHGGPHEAESGVEGDVVAERNGKEMHDGDVEGDGGGAFEPDEAGVAGVDGFEKGGGGAIDGDVAFDAEVLAVENEGGDDGDRVAEDDEKVVEAGEDAEPDEPFPDEVVAFEVEIEGFVVGTVSEVVADVALADEMEGGWEEKGHEDAGDLVGAGVWEEHGVLGFVDDGVDGVHEDAEGGGEEGEGTEGSPACGKEETGGDGDKLEENHDGVEAPGDGVSRGGASFHGGSRKGRKVPAGLSSLWRGERNVYWEAGCR